MSTETNFESYWPQIKSYAEAQNTMALVNLMDQVSDRKQRVSLYRFAVRSLMFREWTNKSLEPLIDLGDRAIALALEIGEIDEANIINYNMSSNLAACWDDGFVRTAKHFEKGLHYAQKALEFRKQLNKGPLPFSMAYWAEGAHHFFLKDHKAAEKSFSKSLECAIQAAKAEGQNTLIAADSSFFVLNSYGYLSLAQWALGQKEAAATFDKVIASFEAMKSISEDAKADAEIGLEQLSYVRRQWV